MLNVEDARKALRDVKWVDEVNVNYKDEIAIIEDFINEVERLLHYNAIKQTPALFRVPK